MSNPYRRTSDLPFIGKSPSTRPPSYSTEIPISRSSVPDRYRHGNPPRNAVTNPAPTTGRPSQSQVREAAPPEEGKKVCEDCGNNTQPIWNCSYCGMDFCNDCWDRQAQHRPGRKGPDGLPHEKANPSIVRRYKEILTPPQDHNEQQTLHVEDEDTTWFGLSRDQQNRPMLKDYGRYSTIMADSNTGEFKHRYPQLVSFIGQTGAGKSTLIKMLIDQQERRDGTRNWTFPSPVAGALSNGSVPTSGDVHLYSDPSTYAGEHPMLYADCEGLEGGENTPMAAKYRERAGNDLRGKAGYHHMPKDNVKRRKKSNPLYSTQRDITWANSESTSKRQYAVTELYPRLLYTFSDAIVFVLRNPKTFESTVLSMLINWASTSLEKSVNQPALPHAIIALNATDTKVDPQEWNSEHATHSLMSTISGAIHRDSKFRQLAEEWRARGKKIKTMKHLLECFYSSITVVRVPGEGRYMMIDDQISKLREIINKTCAESFNAKRKSRMLSNSETLNVYLQCAYDHFASDLHKPFDFMDVSFKINPIPLDFGGNILKLAVALKSRYVDNPRRIFEELSYMVSSCILLDCVRQGFRGTPEQILEKQYLEYCDNALDDFCAVYWPCTFQNRHGGRCVNVRERHTKGHQNQRGTIIGSGAYVSGFTFDNFAESWSHHLRKYTTGFQSELAGKMVTSPVTDELATVTDLHLANVNRFFHDAGGAIRYTSHSSCFCCLRNLAEHPLACGHVLCTTCIKDYGEQSNDLQGLYTFPACPLHQHDQFRSPSEIYFKPPLAGVRILSLDGGGMRGIVILEVLRHIQAELGDGIPIQDFFDLIVGTSTGGILALGLGVKNWRVEDCMNMFTRLIDKAFTRKIFGGVTLGKTKYRTQPLDDALKECFGNEALFGGELHTPRSGRKVAVTSATETGEQAVIFTNYNRVDDEEIHYRLKRPHHPEDDVMIREAARATSAAPTFFKPFRNERTKEGFLDGAVFHNNPVRIANYESKLLWPDAERCHPDILLSLGTGRHGIDEPETFLNVDRGDNRRMQMRRKLYEASPTVKKKRSMAALSGFAEIESWLTILTKRVESVLDAENTWKEFRQEITASSPIAASRYIRMNPRTSNRTPKMDDKAQLQTLQFEIQKKLGPTTSLGLKIKAIAHRLVASSFYFEKSGLPRMVGDGDIVIQGSIRCRFAVGSENIRNLGIYLRKHQKANFQPFFRIHEVALLESAQTVCITAEIIRDMIERSIFRMESIAIPMTTETAILSMNMYLVNEREASSGYSISGFPRSVTDEESLRRQPTPSSPNLERSKMATKRQSLRVRRHQAAQQQQRPASDSEILTLRNIPESERNHSSLGIYPETPDDVTDWERRRREASRRPPETMFPLPESNAGTLSAPLEGVYELDAGLSGSLHEQHEALVHQLNGQVGDNSAIPQITGSETENEIAMAMELSRREEVMANMRRQESGFDQDEVARAIALSLNDQ
ncbi:hypothetical protein BU24DRAFT_442957 [Aaosphaeria arxii CBS 175.79]|uniref:FabD/lysophospholipase-like protein n=1 Tax=Aaosphaeria arxii CBS 175.79 TaxID=1450172 RepID=A0A6A5XH36_9PLEO|nr:uncharacterized protein BU24DRAFT_442957 [Aaosphaeria arxii CBS 175.79]KAF2012508.1 hypothetical protein BU24DRAFT_442957 [Aaosphaeria arxii CBS 175.79]